MQVFGPADALADLKVCTTIDANGLASVNWLPRDALALREIGTKIAGTDLASLATWLTVVAHLALHFRRVGGRYLSYLVLGPFSITKTQVEN